MDGITFVPSLSLAGMGACILLSLAAAVAAFLLGRKRLGARVSSFFVDYNSLGNKYEDTDDVLEIWITTGRDQSTVLKTMVDDTFTANTGIKVNVKLVQQNAILPAVVAGNGPDIVLTVSG